jgi:hypothetical protein
MGGINTYAYVGKMCIESSDDELVTPVEPTPDTNPGDFENLRGTKAKKNKKTGEIWDPDLLHKDHWEVYKNKKNFEKGQRDRAVWSDGQLKEQF